MSNNRTARGGASGCGNSERAIAIAWNTPFHSVTSLVPSRSFASRSKLAAGVPVGNCRKHACRGTWGASLEAHLSYEHRSHQLCIESHGEENPVPSRVGCGRRACARLDRSHAGSLSGAVRGKGRSSMTTYTAPTAERRAVDPWATQPSIACRWTAAGPVSGTCGHLHHSRDSALECCDAHARDCHDDGTTSDRVPVPLSDWPLEALPP